jgi:hypothetical protein
MARRLLDKLQQNFGYHFPFTSTTKFLRRLITFKDFLNGICTNIINMQNQRLQYYTGNYDAYVRARAEKEENQMKQYNWEQDQIHHMKEYIARFGHGSAVM